MSVVLPLGLPRSMAISTYWEHQVARHSPFSWELSIQQSFYPAGDQQYCSADSPRRSLRSIPAKRSSNQQNQHWSYGTYEAGFDSLTAIKMDHHISSTTAQNQYGDSTLSTFNGIGVNSSLRTIQDNVSRQNIGGDASYRIRARHNASRLFTFFVGWTSSNLTTSGYLYSIDRFYQPDGSLESIDTTDQRKQVVNQLLNLNSSITYCRTTVDKSFARTYLWTVLYRSHYLAEYL